MEAPEISTLQEDDESPEPIPQPLTPPPPPPQVNKFKVTLRRPEKRPVPSTSEVQIESEDDEEQDQLADDDDLGLGLGLGVAGPSPRAPAKRGRVTSTSSRGGAGGRKSAKSSPATTTTKHKPAAVVGMIPAWQVDVSSDGPMEDFSDNITPIPGRKKRPPPKKSTPVTSGRSRKPASRAQKLSLLDEVESVADSGTPHPPSESTPLPSPPHTSHPLPLPTDFLPHYPLPTRPFPVQPLSTVKFTPGNAVPQPLDLTNKTKPRRWRVMRREIKGVAGGRWFANTWVGEKDPDPPTNPEPSPPPSTIPPTIPIPSTSPMKPMKLKFIQTPGGILSVPVPPEPEQPIDVDMAESVASHGEESGRATPMDMS